MFHNHSKMYNSYPILGGIMIYKGKKYYISKQGYYTRDERSGNKRKTLLLHRIIWEDNFGAIPEGFHIHHKDENRINNDINNLECVSLSHHASHHRKEEWESGKLNYLVKAQKKWLQTENGKLKKSESAQNGWIKRKFYKKNCQKCEKEFETQAPQAKWCSNSCKYKNWYHKDKK